MFGLIQRKKPKRTRKPAATHKAAPRQPCQQRARPEIGEVYVMIKRTKDMLDMIPDLELAKAKSTMNTLEDLIWQAVHR